ncbi:MAG: hypothetical protein DME29_01370 [Verrucomicrobia bacterium]|nr:MAG: hypothetical protein DME29_01370 [Verrucomicrobiota bacterium]
MHFALSLAGIALTITGTIPHHTVTLDHTGDVGLSGKVRLTTSDLGGFDLNHSGDVEIIR